MKLEFLFQKKMVICCGTGGVGKTTISAALALSAAQAGKRVGLITIDPARRLATSLGLSRLHYDPQSLDKYIEKELGKGKLGGSLDALMLDSENAFYRFLKNVGGEEVHDRFRTSSLFEIIAGNFGGTHDYLAMEKLFELHSSGRYDLIVLDTPPPATPSIFWMPPRISPASSTIGSSPGSSPIRARIPSQKGCAPKEQKWRSACWRSSRAKA
jgi:anion-transporting  ArsA/GET3 family ATPase